MFAKKDDHFLQEKVREKTKFVAVGYEQQEKNDYNKLFSLVIEHSSIRILLTLVM